MAIGVEAFGSKASTKFSDIQQTDQPTRASRSVKYHGQKFRGSSLWRGTRRLKATYDQ